MVNSEVWSNEAATDNEDTNSPTHMLFDDSNSAAGHDCVAWNGVRSFLASRGVLQWMDFAFMRAVSNLFRSTKKYSGAVTRQRTKLDTAPHIYGVLYCSRIPDPYRY